MKDSNGNTSFIGISHDKKPKGYSGNMPMDGKGTMVYYQNGIETYRISSNYAINVINSLIK